MREDVHACAIEVTEPRLLCRVLTINEIERRREKLFVHSLHSLLGQRAGVGDLPVRRTLQHPAWAELLFELRVLWVVGVLRLFFRIQVIEVSEELVEAVIGWKKLIFVAEVILAEL